jgi:hypothetical protein
VSAYPEGRRANSKPPQFVERASKEINWPPIRWFEVSTDDEGNYRPLIAMPYRRSLTLRDARVLRNYRLPLGCGCSYLRA